MAKYEIYARNILRSFMMRFYCIRVKYILNSCIMRMSSLPSSLFYAFGTNFIIQWFWYNEQNILVVQKNFIAKKEKFFLNWYVFFLMSFCMPFLTAPIARSCYGQTFNIKCKRMESNEPDLLCFLCTFKRYIFFFSLKELFQHTLR